MRRKRSTMHYMVLASAVVWFSGALTACNFGSSVIAEDATTFEVHYSASFEVSSFVPCGMAGRPSYGKGYWLEPSTDFFQKYEKFVAAAIPQPVPGRRFEAVIVYVRFDGELAPERFWFGSGYGHLGAYNRMVTVRKLLEMRSPVENDCLK